MDFLRNLMMVMCPAVPWAARPRSTKGSNSRRVAAKPIHQTITAKLDSISKVRAERRECPTEVPPLCTHHQLLPAATDPFCLFHS